MKEIDRQRVHAYPVGIIAETGSEKTMNPVGKGQKRNNGQHDKDASPVSVIGKKEQRKEAKTAQNSREKDRTVIQFQLSQGSTGKIVHHNLHRHEWHH